MNEVKQEVSEIVLYSQEGIEATYSWQEDKETVYVGLVDYLFGIHAERDNGGEWKVDQPGRANDLESLTSQAKLSKLMVGALTTINSLQLPREKLLKSQGIINQLLEVYMANRGLNVVDSDEIEADVNKTKVVFFSAGFNLAIDTAVGQLQGLHMQVGK